MARTVAEIKKTMTDAFMADATIREKYGLNESSTWNGSFSSVSLENIIFFIVAACCHVLEYIFDSYMKAVEEKVAMAVVASVPWYYKMAMAFQYGDSLVLNEATQQYEYATLDESKQVVKYAAVRDRGTSVQIIVSGEINFGVNPTKYNTCIKSYLQNNTTSYTMNYSEKVNFNNT